MELTPETTTVSVCLIREVMPPESVDGYPYRDVALVYDGVSHMMRFPVFRSRGFLPKMLGEDAVGAEEIRVAPRGDTPESELFRIFLQREAFPPTPDPTFPTTVTRTPTGDLPQQPVRVLMSEVASGRYCHVKIHPEVRDVLFPKPGTDAAAGALSTGEFPSDGYNPAERGRLVSPLALVSREEGEGDRSTYYPLPLIGYHGTSEYFVPDILTGRGLVQTTEKGLYGNNAYYFGTFHKAIRYAFRDSQYATVGERAPLRDRTRPAGYVRVPGTRHPEGRQMVEDLVRDSPALFRFVLFPSNTTIFPEGDPVKMLPKYGTPEGGRGKSLSARFLRFVNGDGKESVPRPTAEEMQSRVDAAIASPLFNGDETADGIGLKDGDAVIPVPPPMSLVDRKKAAVMAAARIHFATREIGTEVPSVILMREPGALPDLGDLFLMTAGFLTNTLGGVPGDSVTYINEDEIRELTKTLQDALAGGEGSDVDGVRPRPFGAMGRMTDHRILMEDLASVTPAGSPVLFSCATLPPSSLLRVRDALSRGGSRPVLVLRARCKDGAPIAGENDAASPHSYTKRELASIRTLLDSCEQALGGVSETLTYSPPSAGVFSKGVVVARSTRGTREPRVCSLRMEHGTFYEGEKRLLNDRSVHSPAYMKEYPTGGSYRVYQLVREPAKISMDDQIEALRNTLREMGWDPEGAGSSDTLVIQPFSFEAASGSGVRRRVAPRSLTQHTEIVVAASDKPRFLPISWHRGDQRTMYRHHHPMDTGMRVI